MERAPKLEDMNLISNFVTSVSPFIPQESKAMMNAEALLKLWCDIQIWSFMIVLLYM